jgi:hypothetical protein
MPASKSYLDAATSEFVVEGYNRAPPFSSFLPGIAGKWGIPVWCYYVNRGQCVSSFGVRDKDGQILEFQSFNQACMRIDREGFRTFLRTGEGKVYEPFQRAGDPVKQSLRIAAGEITLSETNPSLGLEIEVCYWGLPNERVAGLVRTLRIKNLKKKPVSFDWLDGLPRLLPYGLDQKRIKGIPRHIEAMMGALEREGTAVYRLKQTADDSERVAEIEGGNFYLRVGRDSAKGLVVDPEAVFGEPFSYETPARFASGGARSIARAPQYWENKTPAAMWTESATLAPGEELIRSSIFGFAPRDRDLDALVARARHPSFLAQKREENRRVIDEIADTTFTVSASPELDAYSRQDFLDNVVRGGMPLALRTQSGRSVVYVYSRQNGDLERDYHHFVLEPTYLSQGTGHYRSVLQNRRTDPWFFPETEDHNLKTFLDLVQLDGYNPLEVLGLSYRVTDFEQAKGWIEKHVDSSRARGELSERMAKGFSPGELVMWLEDAMGLEPERRLAMLEEALGFCEENEVGALHEGFWVDHWHYNVDLLEVVLMIHPDRAEELLLGRRDYVYFDDPDVVVPRAERAVDAGGKIRSYGAVLRHPEKLRRIALRATQPHTVRSQYGEGEIYRTSLLVKLLTIVVNRLATLDAEGSGIEMEAGKPGWNDSMNGLPGLFGSGSAELLELGRTIELLQTELKKLARGRPRSVAVYEELADLMRELLPLMKTRATSRSPRAGFVYWDGSNALKEAYRERTLFGVSGVEAKLPLAEVIAFLRAGGELIERAFSGKNRDKLVSKSGVPYTYFVNDVSESERTGRDSPLGYPTVVPRAFVQRPVKLFLEGPVHWMKHRRSEAKAVYDAVLGSPLFDKKLKMYKSCENMRGESPELGRAVGAYPRGFIENESIYLHMEYKYLLEVLRAGLCEEFWHDAKRALVPFMDPAVYGRSTLEGASFIVSSAYAAPELHGRAFQPRLSGITCEFLHIWILAVAGEHPFRLDRQGKLELCLEPRLPGWLFTEQETEREYLDARQGWTKLAFAPGSFAFKFLGHTLVVYENGNRKDTYGTGAARARAYALTLRNGKSVKVTGKALPTRWARAVRGGEVARIDVVLK